MKEGGRQEGAVDRACGSQRKRGSSREEWSARSNDAGLQKHEGGALWFWQWTRVRGSLCCFYRGKMAKDHLK